MTVINSNVSVYHECMNSTCNVCFVSYNWCLFFRPNLCVIIIDPMLNVKDRVLMHVRHGNAMLLSNIVSFFSYQKGGEKHVLCQTESNSEKQYTQMDNQKIIQRIKYYNAA